MIYLHFIKLFAPVILIEDGNKPSSNYGPVKAKSRTFPENPTSGNLKHSCWIVLPPLYNQICLPRLLVRRT